MGKGRPPLLPAEARQILELIDEGQKRDARPPTIKELVDHFGLPRKTIQKYLGMLVDAGFIKRGRREVRVVIPTEQRDWTTARFGR